MTEPTRLQTNTQLLAERQGEELARLRQQMMDLAAEGLTLATDNTRLEAELVDCRTERHRLRIEVRGHKIILQRLELQVERLLALGVTWFAAAGIATGMILWWLAP